MNEGYIKSYRSNMDKSYYQKPEYFLLWHHLLYKANWKEKSIVFRNKEFPIKRGQFVTSIRTLEKETRINRSKIVRILNFFKSETQIETKNFYAFTLISIINYSRYQQAETLNETRVRHERDTSETRVRHTNKDKKDNNKKKKSTTYSKKKEKQQIIFSFKEKGWKNITKDHIKVWEKAYPACDINLELAQMEAWLLANPDKKKSQYERFINNWLKKSQDRGGTKKKGKGDNKELIARLKKEAEESEF